MRVVLFDIDGVLINSRRANLEFYKKLLFSIGKKKIAEDQITSFFGHTMADIIKHFYPNLSQEKIKQGCHLGLRIYPDFYRFVKLEKNIKPILRQLKSQYRLGIVTSRVTAEVLDYFNLSGFFQALIAFKDYKQPKPQPESLLLAIKKLKVDPQEAVYIGDSKSDEGAAKRAKMAFISYKNSSLNTPYHLTDFKQLPKMLAKMS